MPDDPGTPDIYGAKIEFKVQRPAWGVQTVSMYFTDPEGEAEEHLLALWRIWYAGELDRARLAGGKGDIPLA